MQTTESRLFLIKYLRFRNNLLHINALNHYNAEKKNQTDAIHSLAFRCQNMSTPCCVCDLASRVSPDLKIMCVMFALLAARDVRSEVCSSQAPRRAPQHERRN